MVSARPFEDYFETIPHVRTRATCTRRAPSIADVTAGRELQESCYNKKGIPSRTVLFSNKGKEHRD